MNASAMASGAALLVALVVCVSATLASDEWPVIRGDAQNTGATPLRADMEAAPETRASFCLGGSPASAGASATGYVPPDSVYLAADLNGDGREEIVTAAGGPVRAIRGDGHILWSTLIPRGQPNLIGVADLDGCGTPEIVCATGLPATIHILSGREGHILWQRSFDEQVYFMQGTRIADLDGDGRPELFVLGNAPAENSRRLGWAFSFKGGFAKPQMLWGGQPLPFNPHYRPQTIVADIDGDSKPEVVVASAVHANGVGLLVAAFDGATGKLKRQADFANGDRNYGHLQAVRAPGKPQLDLLVVGMLGREHITYLTNDATTMREAWHINGTFQIPYNPVADVDGDGKLELIYTRDDSAGREPRPQDVVLTMRDLATGAIKREVPGLRLQGLVDLNGTGKTDMIATTVPEGCVIIRAGGPRQQELPVPGARLCLAAPWPPANMMNEALANRSGYNVFARDLDGNGSQDVFVTTSDRLLAVDSRTLVVTLEHRFANDTPQQLLGDARVADPKRPALLLAGDDGLTILSPKDAVRALVPLHNLPPRVPTAARLKPGGAMVALASPANRDLIALDGPALCVGEVRRLWLRRGLGGFEAPAVQDCDGDGVREILACDLDSAKIVILDPYGRVRRRLGPLPTDGTPLVTGTCAIGRFGDGSHLMVGASSGVGPNDGQATWTVIDPANGRVAWQREGGPHPRRTPAVWDVDGDGVDDLVYSHYFDFCEADGHTGQYLHYVPNVVAGYHLATVADLDASGKPSVLLSGGYMGIYRFGLDGHEIWRTPPLDYNAGSAAAVADVDGDGKPEFGTAFSDRFDCYDAAAGKVKWSLPLPGRGSDVVAVDIDGDGRLEFLFGCADGKLYAVKASADGKRGKVLWTVVFGAPVGQPAIADLDGDGRAEILVCTQDGYLHLLARAR